MKLTRFNKATCYVRIDGQAGIYIHHSGSIAFNSIACERIGITEKSAVELLQDGERKKDWYVVLSHTLSAVPVRKRNQKGKFGFNSVAIAQVILKSIVEVPPMPATASLVIATEPITVNGELLWPIITAGYKTK